MATSQDWDGLFDDESGAEPEFTFAQLEQILGIRLPSSAYIHPTWWRSVENAPWQASGWKAFPNLRKRYVRFERMKPIPATPEQEATDETTSKVLSSEPRLVLIGGVSGKRDVARPARDLYDSVLWSKRMAYAEATGRPWMILSSEYGLVHPDTVIEPYDSAMSDQSSAYRRAWSDNVAAEVISLCAAQGFDVLEVHAGADQMLNGLVEHLNGAGLVVSWPLRGRRIGEQLSWYSLALSAMSSLPTTDSERSTPGSSARADESEPVSPNGSPEAVDADGEQESDSGSEDSSRSVVVVASALSAIKRSSRSIKASLGEWRSQLSAEISRRSEPDSRKESGALSLGRQVKLAESLAYFAESRRILDALLEEPWTGNAAADDLLRANPFALLVGVLINQGVGNVEAWDAPWLLQERVGPLEPERLVDSEEDLIAGIEGPPALHRSPEKLARAIAETARTVIDDYGGDASLVWSDAKNVRELRKRLESFPGVGPRQSSRAAEVLQRRIGVRFPDSGRGAMAYEADLRRVMLRSGLADFDDIEHMTMQMSALNPDDPGSLDPALLAIGTLWCHPVDPACHACAIGEHCPKIIESGGGKPQTVDSTAGAVGAAGESTAQPRLADRTSGPR